jgi:hypothetical protein
MKRFTITLCVVLFASFGFTSAQETYLEFDETAEESYVDCGASPDFSPAEFTIETWVRYCSFYPFFSICAPEDHVAEVGPQGFVLRKAEGEFDGTYVELNIGTMNDDWNSVVTGSPFNLDEWYHIAATFDGMTITLYVNGEYSNDGAVPSAMRASSQALFLGEGAAWKGRRLDGDMYDFRFWNVVRTETEIADNMNSYLNGDEEGLVANWKMDEGTGTTLTDNSPNGYDAYLGTAVVWGVATSAENVLADSNANIELVPNPARDVVNVSNTSNNETVVRLVDASGKTCKTFTLAGNSSKNVQISELKNGLYFVISEDVSGQSVSKFFVY